MGNLIVFEGTDGSGKSTQLTLAREALEQRGVAHRSLRFPRYGEPSSQLLRMYLEGQFGSSPGDVNPYAASTFFAVDRYASWKTDWGAEFEAGKLILCDRYTTSNAIHQASKLDQAQAAVYLEWLFDYEYRLLGLPAPTRVIYFHMPADRALELMRERQTSDIHERDAAYLERCQRQGLALCQKQGWQRVDCERGGALRTPRDIHEEVMNLVLAPGQ